MEFETFEDDYEILETIGAGTFSEVKKGREKKENGKLVALKFIKLHGDDKLPPHLIREASILGTVTHQNVVSLLGVNLDAPLFIFELMETDLHNLLYNTSRCRLPEADVAKYTSHMIAGLHAIHLCRIIHRDLKPANVCISKDGVAKICDFGSARATCSDVPTPYTREVTTLFYRAPEMILGAPGYSFPVDMWALACILAEMILGQIYFFSSSEIGMIFAIFRKLGTPNSTIWPGLESFTYWRSDLPCFLVPSQIYDMNNLGFVLMFELLQYDPSRRLTAQRAMEHPFVSGVK